MIKNSIVLVPFPFDDLKSYKVRPALCLTPEIGNFEQVIIAFISSKVSNNVYPSDLILRKGGSGWEKSGLLTDSVISLHKVVTIQKSLIQRRIGRLDKKNAQLVREKLIQFFS